MHFTTTCILQTAFLAILPTGLVCAWNQKAGSHLSHGAYLIIKIFCTHVFSYVTSRPLQRPAWKLSVEGIFKGWNSVEQNVVFQIY